MTRITFIALALILTGCAWPDDSYDPELKTLGATQPTCLLGCFLDQTIIDTREGVQNPNITNHSQKTTGGL